MRCETKVGVGAYSLVVEQFHGMEQVRVRFPVGPPKETSTENEERVAVREADGCLPEMKSTFACAVNSKSSPQLHESVLSLRMGFEPKNKDIVALDRKLSV